MITYVISGGPFCDHIPYLMWAILEIQPCDYLCDNWGSFCEHILEIQSCDYLCDNWGSFREHIPYPMPDIFEILFEILCNYLCDKWGPFFEHIPYPMWVILEIQSYAITYVITGVRFVNIFPILWETFFEILCEILWELMR